MKSDNIIAVAGGFLFGAVSAILLVNSTNIINYFKKSETSKSLPIPTTTENKNVLSLLTITEPPNNSILASSSAQISGKSRIGDKIILETEEDIYYGKTDNDGKFNISVKLIEGLNKINIFSYAQNVDTETQKINLFYTAEKI
jgi:hypothetical protein